MNNHNLCKLNCFFCEILRSVDERAAANSRNQAIHGWPPGPYRFGGHGRTRWDNVLSRRHLPWLKDRLELRLVMGGVGVRFAFTSFKVFVEETRSLPNTLSLKFVSIVKIHLRKLTHDITYSLDAVELKEHVLYTPCFPCCHRRFQKTTQRRQSQQTFALKFYLKSFQQCIKMLIKMFVIYSKQI